MFKEGPALEQLWGWLPGGGSQPGGSQRGSEGSLRERSQPGENQNATLESIFDFSGTYAWTPQEQ